MNDDYIKARKLGTKAYQRALSDGLYPYPTVLDQLLNDDFSRNEYPVGIIDIPMELIAGTKTAGRTNAFAVNFMPLLEASSEFASKWQNLYNSQIEEGIREPIMVYEYMHKFYVQEGNKRVSVLRYVKSPTVTGNVTRILPKGSGKEYELYKEFLDFYQVCPLYDIDFSQEGSYKKLAETLGRSLDETWPEDLVRSLKTSYYIFRKTFRKIFGEKIKISDSDAFLIYLQYYPLDSVRNSSDQLLTERIRKTGREILINVSSDNIDVVDENSDLPQRNSIRKIIGAFTNNYSRENPLKAAFFYERPARTSNWLYSHELGRNSLDEAFSGMVVTRLYDSLDTDEKLKEAIDDAVKWGAEICFTVSPKQMPETVRSALHYENVRFMNCSINLPHANVRTYYGRMYEAKFVLGALAASLSGGKNIGYLASYPIFGQAAEINAFAIGAALINPEVRVILKWASVKDSDYMKEFREEGINIISGPDSILPEKASREYGLFRIKDGSISNLAFPVWDWGKYYQRILESIMQNDWDDSADPDKATNYYLGFGSGVIDVILSDHLSYYSRKGVESLKTVILSGILNPFDGEIHSQDGVVKKEGDPSLSYEDIIKMDWLNDNVEGSFPKKEELKEDALDTISISGLFKEYQ